MSFSISFGGGWGGSFSHGHGWGGCGSFSGGFLIGGGGYGHGGYGYHAPMMMHHGGMMHHGVHHHGVRHHRVHQPIVHQTVVHHQQPINHGIAYNATATRSARPAQRAAPAPRPVARPAPVQHRRFGDGQRVTFTALTSGGALALNGTSGTIQSFSGGTYKVRMDSGKVGAFYEKNLLPFNQCSAGLPPGWEGKQSPDGRTYYINHHTKQTQWTRPGAVAQAPAVPIFKSGGASGGGSGPALAQGWEAKQDSSGKTYYLNHSTQTTQWERPTAAAPPPAAPTKPQAAHALPSGWSSKIDQNTGRTYYINNISQQTQWEPPKVTEGGGWGPGQVTSYSSDARRAVFDKYDADNSQSIDLDELCNCIRDLRKVYVARTEVDIILKWASSSPYGQLSFEEFCKVLDAEEEMKRKSKPPPASAQNPDAAVDPAIADQMKHFKPKWKQGQEVGVVLTNKGKVIGAAPATIISIQHGSASYTVIFQQSQIAARTKLVGKQIPGVNEKDIIKKPQSA